MLRSDCSDLVGMPVDGPPRMTLTMTIGVSEAVARPKASIISDRPGPEVAVTEGVPPNEAPMIIAIEAISSSAWTSTPPTVWSAGDSHSSTSVAGVIG